MIGKIIIAIVIVALAFLVGLIIGMDIEGRE